jgi:glutamine synthetase
VKGECNLGQQEIAFRYDTAVTTCDNHSIYKNGSKVIADRHGKSLTFMAKFNEREGNSCHIHLSLRSESGEPVFADKNAEHGMSTMFRHFLAGQIAAMQELSLFLAPNVNSYKRYVEGSFAPTAIAWGIDNRTASFRVIAGSPKATRLETRCPGADVNPYLAMAAVIAAGLDGVEKGLKLTAPPITGTNVGAEHIPRAPRTLIETTRNFQQSAIARDWLGDGFVDHFAATRDWEWRQWLDAVTDWEMKRYFEII